MKAELIGKKYNNGFATLEVLIAFTVLILSMGAIIIITFGNQSLAVDLQTNNEATLKAKALLEKARADSRSDFASVVTTPIIDDDIYKKQIIVDPASITQCGKDIKSNVTWVSGNRTLNVNLITRLGDLSGILALGGNCDINPPSIGWNPPETWATDNFNPGKPNAFDSLNKMVYIAANKNPYLFIANTNNVTKGQTSGVFVSTGTFNDGAILNDIKVARATDGKVYAFVARNTSTNQFEVIDVNVPENTSSIVKRSLIGINGGSYPEGYRIYYYDKKAYIITRETAGPELHIFNVATPWDPDSVVELGFGKELNRTVEDFVVSRKNISGVDHYLLYAATDKNSAELSVFDVTIPTSINEAVSANQNLPGNQDGASIFLQGNYLYFGRASTNGSDLYIYDVTNPFSGFVLKQQQNIGTSVIGLSTTGPYIFMVTLLHNSEFQVWTSDPNKPIVKVNTTNFVFPNTINRGIKYENNWVYVAGQGGDALRILYNSQ